MASLNKVLFIGNLTRDPELRYSGSGMAIATFGLAVNTKSGGKDGESKEEVLFIDVTSFARQAETVSEYLKKGRPALIEGRLQLQQWESQDGQKRSKHVVIAERVTFLGGRDDSTGGGGEQPVHAKTPPKGQEAARVTSNEPLPEDDDIPFITCAVDEFFMLHNRERFMA